MLCAFGYLGMERLSSIAAGMTYCLIKVVSAHFLFLFISLAACSYPFISSSICFDFFLITVSAMARHPNFIPEFCVENTFYVSRLQQIF